jgi:adenosylcobyric acid synthase
MKVALHAAAPVLIVGDIDRGGVFAHLYGTYHLLEPEEQALVKGFIINRFRGDASLLTSGLKDIERLTTVPVVGVVPWIRDHGLPEEDSVALDERHNRGRPATAVDVAVVKLPRIANFDDFDPLEAENDVNLRYVEHGNEIGRADIVVIPGTKATVADLGWLREHGFEGAIRNAHTAGALVLGVCGGLQMLGTAIHDPAGVESATPEVAGLGMLDVVTEFIPDKTTRLGGVRLGTLQGPLAGLSGLEGRGYEIHAGISRIDPAAVAATSDDGRPLGAVTADGTVLGCYLHGLFQNDAVRRALLAAGAARRGKQYTPTELPASEAGFDKVAEVLRGSLDLPAVYRLIGREAP